MFTSKQRSNLRSLAQNITPITQVGNGGVSENLVKSLSDALDARELIKISVLNNAENDARDIAEELSAALNAETVAIIGKKIILYRKSDRKDVNHIKF